jgi:hypothetical protein
MARRTSFVSKVGAAAVAVATLASPAAAQSTNARPVIVLGAADANPATIPLLNEEARKALKEAMDALKSGRVAAHVLSAAPDGKSWTSRTASKMDFVSIDDLARQGLEGCEYFYQAPCFIVAINGRDARDAVGGFPTQPRMLAREAGLFDNERVPFVTAQDRVAFKTYASGAPRAFMVTTLGGWLWRSGDTILQAISTASSDCEKTYPNHTCLLYAVNDRIVFSR